MRAALRKVLEADDLAASVDMVRSCRQVFSQFVRLAYAKDTLVGWRAILAVGMAARELVKTDAAFLREACRKLLWSLSDESGGIGWSAPELLGEIAAADPKQFADLVPLIAGAYEVEEDVFRPGVLYALARIAEQAPELAAVHQKAIISSLADREPLVRVRGIMLVAGLLPAARARSLWSREYTDRILGLLKVLEEDKGEAWIYRGNDFTSVTVMDETNKAMKLVI